MYSRLIPFIAFFLVAFSVKAQDFTVPADYKLEVAADYARYEKDIIAAANWLRAVPLNEQETKRREVSAFVLLWINGSPTVNVEINPTVMDFEKKNAGMLMVYMSACARYVLENNYSKDMRAKHRAAIRDLITVYKAGKSISKDKKMEKLIKAEEAGDLDAWLEENLKVGSR